MARRDWTVPFETWPTFTYGQMAGSVTALPLWLPQAALTDIAQEPAAAGVPESNAKVMLEACRGTVTCLLDPTPFQGQDWVVNVDIGIAIVTQSPQGIPLLGSTFDFSSNTWANAMDWVYLDNWCVWNRDNWWDGVFTDVASIEVPNRHVFNIHTKSKRVCDEGQVAALVFQSTVIEGEMLDPEPQFGFFPRLRTLVNMLDV